MCVCMCVCLCVCVHSFSFLSTFFFSLKQRFPSTFKDVCFFSEICAIISSLSFRLNARRFIQELFDEIDITKVNSVCLDGWIDGLKISCTDL